jgi:hypothetical protein
MKTSAQTTFAERAGRTLGRMWRGFAHLDRKACGWLVEQGLPVGAAKALLWIVKLVVLGMLLYAALWLAFLILVAMVAAWLARSAGPDEPEEWAIGEQAEHKSNPGYDPILYNDAPDSRYADPRYNDD